MARMHGEDIQAVFDLSSYLNSDSDMMFLDGWDVSALDGGGGGLQAVTGAGHEDTGVEEGAATSEGAVDHSLVTASACGQSIPAVEAGGGQVSQFEDEGDALLTDDVDLDALFRQHQLPDHSEPAQNPFDHAEGYTHQSVVGDGEHSCLTPTIQAVHMANTSPPRGVHIGVAGLAALILRSCSPHLPLSQVSYLFAVAEPTKLL